MTRYNIQPLPDKPSKKWIVGKIKEYQHIFNKKYNILEQVNSKSHNKVLGNIGIYGNRNFNSDLEFKAILDTVDGRIMVGNINGTYWATHNSSYNPNLYEEFFEPRGKYKTSLWARDKELARRKFLTLINSIENYYV